MNIYFILLFVGVGFFYIIKSVNLPSNTAKCKLFDGMKLEANDLKIYTRYISMYYLIIGVALILLPFIYGVIGNSIAYIAAVALIGGAIIINKKRAFFLNKQNKTSK